MDINSKYFKNRATKRMLQLQEESNYKEITEMPESKEIIPQQVMNNKIPKELIYEFIFNQRERLENLHI